MYSPTGWGAQIKRDDGTTYIRPVEKWSDKGEALVGDASGKLVPAVKVGGFEELVELHRAVAVVPATPGWTAVADPFAGNPGYRTPIAAWVMDVEGTFWPVLAVPTDATLTNPNPKGELSLHPVLSSRFRIKPPAIE